MEAATYHHPDALVSSDWLQAHLGDPDLRVFDCTVYLLYEEASGQPYKVVSGRADYEAGHIPGSDFLDLQGDFSELESPYRFTLPPAELLADAFSRHGIAERSRVVLYSRENMQWASRFWWMLRFLGFDTAAILDGGFDKWAAEGRPTSREPCQYAEGDLTPRPRPDLFVGKEAVLAAIGNGDTCTINALAADLHSGASPRYGRPGRVPGSVNVPAAALQDPETRVMPSPDAAAEAFAAVGATPNKRIITYCGGGIAATLDAFLLHQLGFRDIAVYDSSMSEWASDYTLPIETD